MTFPSNAEVGHYLVDKLPTGKPKMEYDHLCRNVKCVRPEHLELVTAAENRRRQLDSDEVCRARLEERMRKKIEKHVDKYYRVR